MNISELMEASQKISLSDIDSKARFHINKAIDLRMQQLADSGAGCMVEMGEADYDIE